MIISCLPTTGLMDAAMIIREILQWPADSLTGKTLLELAGLVRTMQISVQWIPAHCGICGNEQKDSLVCTIQISVQWIQADCSIWGNEQADSLFFLKPVLNWANVCSPNILRTLRRTMIRFLIEHLVRRIWFGQSKLYFVLNWLVMRCKLRPELAAVAQQTA